MTIQFTLTARGGFHRLTGRPESDPIEAAEVPADLLKDRQQAAELLMAYAVGLAPEPNKLIVLRNAANLPLASDIGAPWNYGPRAAHVMIGRDYPPA
jgi:hypothetical protein